MLSESLTPSEMVMMNLYGVITAVLKDYVKE
jgi:hypothetical protein